MIDSFQDLDYEILSQTKPNQTKPNQTKPNNKKQNQKLKTQTPKQSLLPHYVW